MNEEEEKKKCEQDVYIPLFIFNISVNKEMTVGYRTDET